MTKLLIAGGHHVQTLRIIPHGVSAGHMNVKVLGTDVNGLNLRLFPLATLGGSIAISEKNEAKCGGSPLGPESISLELRSEKMEGDDVFTIIAPASEISVNSQGVFQSSGLAARKYRLVALLPKNNWYVQSIVKPSTRSTATASPGGNPPDSFSLSGGENVNGLIVNVQQDGSVLSGSLSGPDGATTPAGLHLYLVPAEKERLDDTLQFSEFVPNANGGFSFRNLAPGKYYLSSRIAAEPENPAHPLTWDPKQRVKLVDEARAANVAVELKPCQTIRNYQLFVGPDGSIKTN